MNQKIDILGFDSCNMGLLELGFQFKNTANIMVASEGNMPNAGWSYGSLLAGLIAQTQKSGKLNSEKEIARLLVEGFINKQNNYIIGGANVDISAWDLDKISLTSNKLNSLAKFLIKGLKNAAHRKSLVNAIIFSHWRCQSYMMEQQIDLTDFCEILINEIRRFDPKDSLKICAAATDVIKAIRKCVLLCGFSGGQYQYSNGIGLYFPWNANTFAYAENNYRQLSINSTDNEKNVSQWYPFLQKFLTEITLRNHRQTTNSLPSEELPSNPGIVVNTAHIIFPKLIKHSD